MGCNITKGKKLLSCKNLTAGIKSIYLMNFLEGAFDGQTVSNEAGHELLSTGLIPAASSAKFELRHTTNAFTQTQTFSEDNFTTMYSPSLTFVLPNLGKEMEYQFKMMAKGRPFLICKMNNGKHFIMGTENGCQITGKSDLGGTIDGINGYTFTATAKESEPIYWLSAGAIEDLSSIVIDSWITED
jgi:hypothetical protein